MGLLDAFNSPDGQLGLGLLAAAAPSMTPMNFAGRLGLANQNFQASQASALQRQDLAQQIQLRNIALQQQQKEWAIQMPMLQAISDRMNGKTTAADGSTPPATSPATSTTPSIAPSGGGALGSGLFGIPTGGQSATAPATPTAPQGGGSMFPGVPDSVAFPAVAVGGLKAAIPLLTKYNEPTDLQKLARAANVPEGSAQWNQIMQGGLTKANYIAPTRLGSAGYNDPNRGFIPLPAAAPPGFINMPDATDPSGYRTVPVGNGPSAVRAAATAKTAGEGAALPYAGVDSRGNPLPVTNRTAAAMQGTEDPNIPPSTPYQRAASDVQAIKSEIARVNKTMAPDSVKKGQLQILNAELAKAEAGTQAQPAQAVPVPQTQPGAIYSAPPMGAVPNADAAQKASAQAMHDSYTRLQSVGSTATAALDALKKMKELAAKKNPYLTVGPLGTIQSAINPAAAEYEKQRANVISLLAQQSGTNGTDQGRALTGESVPDYGKPKEAIADGLGTLENQTIAQQLKREFLTPHFQAGDSKKYTTLENQFDQNVAPSMVPLLTMPPGPQRAAALQAAAKDPATRARLNWAAENGLLK